MALALVVLGLIAGISMPQIEWFWLRRPSLRCRLVGAALANIPTVGEKLSAVAGNLQLGIAGALASALAHASCIGLAMEGVTGLSSASANSSTVIAAFIRGLRRSSRRGPF